MFNAVLALFIALTPGARAQQMGKVIGAVRMPYFLEEAYIADATILFLSRNSRFEAMSRLDGRFEISLPLGKYEVVAQRPGFCAVPRAEVNVSVEGETIVNLLVVPCPTHVAGPLRTRVIGPEPKNHFKEIVIAFVNMVRTVNAVEYRGTNEYRVGPVESHHIPVVVTSESIALYADTLTLIDGTLRFRASGHVIIEKGKDRTRVNEATIDFGAEDPIATLKVE